MDRRANPSARRGKKSASSQIEGKPYCRRLGPVQAGLLDCRSAEACQSIRVVTIAVKSSNEDSAEGLSPHFLDFIQCLNERRVDFVLIGGYALGVHGVVRATGDMDFLFRRTRGNVRRLCEAMDDFGAPPDLIDEEALMTPEIVTQFGRPPHRIDLLNTIDGVTAHKVWTGAISTTVQGLPMKVIGLAELRLNKKATGRKKDEDDLRRLEAPAARKTR